MIKFLSSVFQFIPEKHRFNAFLIAYSSILAGLTWYATTKDKDGTFENIVANYKARAVSDSLRIAAIGGELDAITAELYKCHDKYNAMGEKAQSIINKIAAQSIEIDKLEKK